MNFLGQKKAATVRIHLACSSCIHVFLQQTEISKHIAQSRNRMWAWPVSKLASLALFLQSLVL